MNIKFDFSGKIALVTGAATGIGEKAAMRLAEAGADVIVCDFNEEEGKKTAQACADAGVRSAFYKVDVADENSVADMAKKVLAEFGHIDFLVNNAGVNAKEKGNPITDIPIKEMRRVIDINSLGLVNMVQSFYENFTTRKTGKIVCTASIAAYLGSVKMPQYSASKAAAISFVKSLALELGPYNVNVNAIAPGYVYTPIYHQAIALKTYQPGMFDDCETSEDVMNKMAKNSALMRAQTTDDMANTIMILCADETQNITGQCLIVDSGRLLK